jgi:hypothetical protein
MHGRLIRTEVRPLPFGEAVEFLSFQDPPAAFERYAITGGMPLYLSRLAAGTTRDAVCGQILDRNGPLWNEGRAILTTMPRLGTDLSHSHPHLPANRSRPGPRQTAWRRQDKPRAGEHGTAPADYEGIDLLVGGARHAR